MDYVPSPEKKKKTGPNGVGGGGDPRHPLPPAYKLHPFVGGAEDSAEFASAGCIT
jgi:hypothetical protein